MASRFRFLNFTRPMRLAILTFPHFPVCCGFSRNLSDYFRLQMFSSRGFWLSPFSTACPSRSLSSHFVVSLPDYRASAFFVSFYGVQMLIRKPLQERRQRPLQKHRPTRLINSLL